ncbi:class I SAM-dependent methyltransferase [Pseudonocardia sp. CA-107938]|uniref:class I SAM-dependent methyltransferase n=1 Tax=Pseudonocardia sp. CA-107938 TaxID=3240021 RepID=UPI003D8D5D25
MSERTSQHGHGHGHGHGHRPFLPAMGERRSVRFYDVFGLLVGGPRMYRAVAGATRLDDTRAPVVLDVGCGTGQLLRRVGRVHPDAQLVGIDPDDRMLDAARRSAARSRVPAIRTARWGRGYAQDLPAGDGTVDRVLSSVMFHHLDADARGEMLAEVRRVLRPDGALVLADFDGSPGRIPLTRRMRHSPMAAFGPGEVAALLTAAGFTIRSREHVQLLIAGVEILYATP